MIKVNFIVDNFGASQLSYYLIKCGNELVNKDCQVVAFYDTITRHTLRPLFPTMQIIEAWAQDGISIATSLQSASNLLSFPGPDHKLFYVWDLEWMRAPQRMWCHLYDIFTHDDLKLIVRTEEYSKALKNAFNKTPEYIVDNFNSEEMYKVINDAATRRQRLVV